MSTEAKGLRIAMSPFQTVPLNYSVNTGKPIAIPYGSSPLQDAVVSVCLRLTNPCREVVSNKPLNSL
jgi:hypothetical protein